MVLISTFQKFKPRIDRKPKDTPQQIHDQLNYLYKKKFGWNVRSEGVFLSTSSTQSLMFAKQSFIFFPIGKYKYVYNNDIDDVTQHIEDVNILSFLHKDWFVNLGIEQDTIDRVLTDIVYSSDNNNLKNIHVGSGTEISFKCKEYYLVNTSIFFDKIDEIYFF